MTALPGELVERTPEQEDALASGAAHEDAARVLGRSFQSLLVAVRRLRGRETQHPGTISYAQYTLLFHLAEQDRLSARELAAVADLAPATVTQMLEALADQGLVARVRSAVDRRVVLSSLTPSGRRRVQARHEQVAPCWRAALAGFDDGELRTAAQVLDRIAAMFDEFEEAG